MMRVAEAEPVAGGRLEVQLVVGPDSDDPAPLCAGLAREGIAARAEALEATLAAPPRCAVALAWLAAPTPASLLAELVAWRDRAAAPARLVGAAPRGDGADSERALAAGFDDFVAGCRSARELSARARALARRLAPRPARPGDRARLGRLVLDLAGHELWVGSHRVALTAMELAVVAALMRAGGRTLSREALLDQAWGRDDLDVGVRAVDNLVCRLRRKLGERSPLVNVRGLGFRLSDR